jgi:hypothetical protein
LPKIDEPRTCIQLASELSCDLKPLRDFAYLATVTQPKSLGYLLNFRRNVKCDSRISCILRRDSYTDYLFHERLRLLQHSDLPPVSCHCDRLGRQYLWLKRLVEQRPLKAISVFQGRDDRHRPTHGPKSVYSCLCPPSASTIFPHLATVRFQAYPWMKAQAS